MKINEGMYNCTANELIEELNGVFTEAEGKTEDIEVAIMLLTDLGWTVIRLESGRFLITP